VQLTLKNNQPKPMKYFPQVLAASPLLPQFIAVCNSGKTPAQIRAWVQAQPEFARLYIPADLRQIRKEHGCGASRGGKRETRGVISYTVADRGMRSRADREKAAAARRLNRKLAS